MRPDALSPERTPNLHALMAAGAHTLTARTVMPSATLPCHMALFHSVPPERHGVTTNTYTPPVRPVPGLFEALRSAGKRAAMFYNWDELRDLARPGSLSMGLYRGMEEPGGDDPGIARAAAEYLAGGAYDFAFCYLGDTDEEGHRSGWMSPAYLERVAIADACIGRVLAALPPDAPVAVTADHGGHERRHGTDRDEDMTIPLILRGPGAIPGTVLDGPISILDIAPTLLHWLHIPPPTPWEGRSLLSPPT
jgi:Uncharacterized proteins of the AP superfamily